MRFPWSRKTDSQTPAFAWDSIAQVGYLYLREGAIRNPQQSFTVGDSEIVVDVDENGQILGLEVLL